MYMKKNVILTALNLTGYNIVNSGINEINTYFIKISILYSISIVYLYTSIL